MADNNQSIKEVLSHWGISSIQSIDRIHENHVFKITANDKVYILKDLGQTTPDIDRFNFLHSVHSHLIDCGLKIPVLLQSLSEEIIVSVDSRNYILYEYIESGAPLKEHSINNDSFYRAGAAIAGLHDALASYADDPLTEKTWREDFAESAPKMLANLCEQLPQEMRSEVKGVMDERSSQFEKVLAGLPEQLIHRDCHPGNILYNATEVIGFIDCDHFCICSPIFDLATYAVHFVKWSITDKAKMELWLETLPSLLSGYNSIRRLSDQEVKAFAYLMLSYHILLAHFFMQQSEYEKAQVEIDALVWMHRNFDRIRGG